MPKKTIDMETKFEAVMTLLRHEEPATVIARRHGMSEQTLHRLRNEFLEGGRDALKSKKQRKNEDPAIRMKGEIDERDKVIAEYTIANRILKKRLDGLI